MSSTWLGSKVGPLLRECWTQSQAEVVYKSRKKVHQPWRPPFCRALYMRYRTSLPSKSMMVLVQYLAAVSPLPKMPSSGKRPAGSSAVTDSGTNSKTLKQKTYSYWRQSSSNYKGIMQPTQPCWGKCYLSIVMQSRPLLRETRRATFPSLFDRVTFSPQLHVISM